LLDAVAQFKASATIASPNGKPIIALLPGSRRMELGKMLAPMMRLAKKHPEYHFVIAGMTLLGDKYYQPIIGKAENVAVVYDKTYDLLSCAHAAVVCSGTATLETALFNVPQVVCYRANAISAAIARPLIGNKIKYISLPNLIADAPIVTELIQDDFTDDRLEKEFQKITTQAQTRQYIFDGYARLHTLLGNAGASDRTAEEIINIMK
jgi:lipid-A-disaccharide synthase